MDCLFCRIIAGEIPSERVMETDDFVAFRDIDPSAPVHVLVVPRKHIATVNDVSEDDDTLVGRMIRAATKIAEQEGIAESGYRLIFNCNRDGGQEVFHIHLHLVGGRRLGPMVAPKS